MHSETVTYRDTVTGREKIENKKTNLKIYIISFHIRTMHTTGNPPEKKPWLQHQLYRHTKTILREREREKKDSVYLFVSFSTCKNTQIRFNQKPALQAFVFLCVSVCLHSPSSSERSTRLVIRSGPVQTFQGVQTAKMCSGESLSSQQISCYNPKIWFMQVKKKRFSVVLHLLGAQT